MLWIQQYFNTSSYIYQPLLLIKGKVLIYSNHTTTKLTLYFKKFNKLNVEVVLFRVLQLFEARFHLLELEVPLFFYLTCIVLKLWFLETRFGVDADTRDQL